MTMTRTVLLALAVLAAAPADAKGLHYRLEPTQSQVGFETDFGKSVISGTMPVATADMTLDFDRVAASKVAVSLNVAGATTNIPFATQAMTGETVLNAGKFPEITFKSTAVRPTDTGAEVKGNITIRGVTHPVTLDARLFRPVGSDPAERRDLQIVLTGRVSRAAFGANGFADMVGDEVRLNIRARILSDG